ncbi:MAG: hypothetical protein WAV20_09190, partial [Blastocatellia bacterium]
MTEIIIQVRDPTAGFEAAMVKAPFRESQQTRRQLDSPCACEDIAHQAKKVRRLSSLRGSVWLRTRGADWTVYAT